MPFARTVLVAISLPLLASVTSASLLEDVSDHAVSYQFDGEGHHDAPDACQDAGAAWSLPVEGSTDGLLVPPDDSSDSFVLEVPRSLVGQRLAVTVAEAPGSPELALTPFAPGCLGTIFDPLNHPAPPPSPPSPGPGEWPVGAARLNDPYACRPNDRVFVVSELEGAAAPPAIHVAWTDGTEASAALGWSNARYAVYSTSDALGVTLKGAWINLPLAWAGEFVLAAGPCDAQDGGAVYGEPPVLGMGVVSFTPVRAGPHVVVVTLAEGAVPGAGPAPCLLCLSPVPAPEPGHVVAGLLADPTSPPSLSVPASCHFCAPQVEQLVTKVSYLLEVRKA